MKIAMTWVSFEFPEGCGDDGVVSERRAAGECDFSQWASAEHFGFALVVDRDGNSVPGDDVERDPPSDEKIALARTTLERGEPFLDYDDEGSFGCSDVALELRAI